MVLGRRDENTDPLVEYSSYRSKTSESPPDISVMGIHLRGKSSPQGRYIHTYQRAISPRTEYSIYEIRTGFGTTKSTPARLAEVLTPYEKVEIKLNALANTLRSRQRCPQSKASPGLLISAKGLVLFWSPRPSKATEPVVVSPEDPSRRSRPFPCRGQAQN